MPQINLLSTGSKKKIAPSKPSASEFADFFLIRRPLLIRSFVCFAVTASLWVAFSYSITKSERTLLELENKVNVLGTNPKEIEKLKDERAALEKKVELIDRLSSRKFFWFEKFEIIANLIPNGVWLTEISSKQEKPLVEKIDGKQVLSSIGKEKTILVVKGTAVADKIQNAVGFIGDFIKNLQVNWKFSKDFLEIKLNNATKENIGGLDVMKFDFTCESK